MGLSLISFLGEDPGPTCLLIPCADIVCKISCDDDSFVACLDGKCIQATVGSWTNNPLYECTDCETAGGMSTGPVFADPGIDGLPGYLLECQAYWYTTSAPSSAGYIVWPGGPGFAFNGITLSGPCTGDPIAAHDTAYFGIVAVDDEDANYDTVQAMMVELCSGGSISLPFLGQSGGGCLYDESPMILKLVDGSECGNTGTTSYNCVSGVCTRVGDDSGTYDTLGDCMASPCARPVVSYLCISDGTTGVCIDPGDGTGLYSTLADCEAAGCNATDCTGIEACAPGIILEIEGLELCTNGGITYTWQNMNGVHFLNYVGNLGGGVHIFEQNYSASVGDYADPGEPWEHADDLSSETYVYQLEVLILCVDGEVTITDWNVNLVTFSPPPTYTGVSSRGWTSPSSTLASTVIDCQTGNMISLFGYTDCNGSTTPVAVLTGTMTP